MKRLLPVFPGVLAVMLIGSVPAYAQEIIYELDFRDVYRDLARSLRPIPRGATAMQDPPGGGCDYGDAHGTIRASYLEGVLATTESSYFTSILCTTTAPGQSMEGLISESRLWINSREADQGSTGICTDCYLVSSVGAHLCAGPSCAGTYWIAHLATIQLPAGWAWPPTVPGCILLNPSMILCSAVSNVAEIPPTPPSRVSR